MKAEVLFTGGLIRTCDRRQSTADALVVKNGRVFAHGTASAMQEHCDANTKVVDLDGGVLLPGFTDGHAHLWGTGAMMGMAQLRGSSSIDEVVKRLESAPASAFSGDWLLGCGWDQNCFEGRQFPTSKELDEAFPNTPVALFRVDGHAFWCNQEALRRADLTSDTPDSQGGKFFRNNQGELTGILLDDAMFPIRATLPRPDSAARASIVKMAVAEFQRQGITAVHDCGASEPWLQTYFELAKAGELGVRLNAMVEAAQKETLQIWLRRGPKRDWGRTGFLAVTTLKLYADGALGSRGAALLEDYSDDPGNRGLLTTTAARLETLAQQARDRGFQMATHAIGDAAVRLVLDGYEAVLAEEVRGDHRWRIEHTQVIDDADVHRFGLMGVTSAVQTQHREDDLVWLDERLGPERSRKSFPWRRLLESGALLIGGSDSPIVAPRPLDTFRFALNGPEAMTRQQALAHLTTAPPRAVFEEQRLGSLAIGMCADCVWLSADLMTVPDNELPGLQVRGTWVAGHCVAGELA